MRITQIDIEGQEGYYAIMKRVKGSDFIEVEMLLPKKDENGEMTGFDRQVHCVQADCDEDLFSMAKCLQVHLDRCKGTNSMVQDYLNELNRLAYRTEYEATDTLSDKQRILKAYKHVQEDAGNLADWIEEELERECDEEKTWISVGKLHHVRGKLIEILAFISGENALDIQRSLDGLHM